MGAKPARKGSSRPKAIGEGSAKKPKTKTSEPKSKGAKKSPPPEKSGKEKKSQVPPKKRRRLWVWLLLLLLLALAFPFAEVYYVKFFPPPYTTLMLFRRIEGAFSEQYKGKIQYRWVPLEKVAPSFCEAVWVAEDARFFDHKGIDWKEVAISQDRAEKTGKPARGASTISMQCARTVFLWQGRSWIRKGLEAGYTILMEKILSKRRIFELYVNTVELGDGIYGVEAAAQAYYKKPASKLTTTESAMIAAMLPYPRGWNPHAPSPRLKSRHVMVLRKMKEARFPVEKLKNSE